MAKCCNNPPNTLVNMVKGDKTCKVNPPSLNVFNAYGLNKLQNFRMNNTLEVNTNKANAGLGKTSVRN